MSGKLPRITASEVIRAVEKAGFFFVRQSGSHRIFRNQAGRRVTVPYHSGTVLHPKVLRNILRDAELTLDDFKRLLG